MRRSDGRANSSPYMSEAIIWFDRFVMIFFVFFVAWLLCVGPGMVSLSNHVMALK
jgi:hypothetical protein